MSEDRGKLRISNDDRDGAIARLQRSLDEGRINLSEFDERTMSVYEAKTQAELDLIFEDLPADRTGEMAVRPSAPAGEAEPVVKRIRRRVPSSFHPLIVVGCITVTIWLISSVASGELQNFWPAWPLGIMAAIGIATWITGDDDDDDDDEDDDDGDKHRCLPRPHPLKEPADVRSRALRRPQPADRRHRARQTVRTAQVLYRPRLSVA